MARKVVDGVAIEETALLAGMRVEIAVEEQALLLAEVLDELAHGVACGL